MLSASRFEWLTAAALATTLLSPARPALARSAGVAALGCDTCHRDGKSPSVTLTASPGTVGQPVTLTIGVSQANGPVAGFYLTTAYDAPGAFQAAEAGTVASSSGVMHTMPRTGSGGTTTFTARYTATEATGVSFIVYALSANGDKSTRGDGASGSQLDVLIGCSGGTYYIDQDGDGYGSTDPAYPARKDCDAPAGYAEKTGDCDDFRAEVHPGAAELCDLRDNDCNGTVDDDIVEQAFCEDRDGDGHGRAGGTMKMDCKPTQGFARCDGDCDDGSADTHPGAAETCDGLDNDCDGEVDEGVREICGVGLCARYATGCAGRCTPGDPFVETCNGYDDDCDGVVDNGTGAALCGDAALTCVDARCTGEASVGGGTSSMGGASSGGASAGAPSVAGTSASGSPSGAPPKASSSSGCSLAPPTAGAFSWLTCFLALAPLLRRRRSSRR